MFYCSEHIQGDQLNIYINGRRQGERQTLHTPETYIIHNFIIKQGDQYIMALFSGTLENVTCTVISSNPI